MCPFICMARLVLCERMADDPDTQRQSALLRPGRLAGEGSFLQRLSGDGPSIWRKGCVMHLRTESLSLAACNEGLASFGYLCLSSGHAAQLLTYAQDFEHLKQVPGLTKASLEASDVPLAVNPVTLSPLSDPDQESSQRYSSLLT